MARIAAMALWLLATLPAWSAEPAPSERVVVVRRSAHTGHASFVRGKDGLEIPVALQNGQPSSTPDDFLKQHGHLFGVTDPGRQLVVDSSRTGIDAWGFSHTTYNQVHRGVPVFSGVLKVHQDRNGGFRAANGDFYAIPDKLNVQPGLSGEQGIARARAWLTAPDAAVEHSELVIVDPAWYGDPPRGARLAYYLILVDPSVPLREALFVDAHSGEVLDQWDLVHTVRFRQVYNANNGPNIPGTLTRSEGQAPAVSFEVNRAYDYSGDFYDYFFRGFQRDSLNNTGAALISTVNFILPNFCPNAQWNGAQTVYCGGATTDDIVAHEFGHGLTQATANLIYQNQSGMLNESFSDVFGEIIDLFNGNAAFAGPPAASGWPVPGTYVGPGTDAPNNKRFDDDACNDASRRWRFGEDAGGGFNGAFRDMWNPPCFNDPSTTNSNFFMCPAFDNGGVHIGSGVGNHAFAMLVDGKTFNGQTVNGIGPLKAGAVWYRALTVYLTPASDYADAYDAFNQAAADLLGLTPLDPRTGLASGTPFSEGDLQDINRALLAVEMNSDGRCGKAVDVLNPAPAPHCTPRFPVYFADFESGTQGWTVSHVGPAGPPTPYNWVRRGSLPFARPGQAFFCDDPSIGDCEMVDETAVHHLLSPVIALPQGLGTPFLSFTHYMASEPGYDGGNVKISVNGGPLQLIAAGSFPFNAYNATLVSFGGGNTNPLAGQPAWSGAGGRWGTSLINLSGLVQGGDTVQLRFEFGKDGCTGVTGWFVDDVELYDCQCTTNEACDDGLFCTGTESCLGNSCVSTGNPCPGYCDELNDACVAAAFSETFEHSNAQGWELQGEGTTALAGHWVIGDPNGTTVNGMPAQPESAFLGTGCAFTGQNTSAEVDDVDGGVVALVSPPIDLSTAHHAQLSYARWFFLRDLAPGSDDFFAVDLSNNDGASWFTLELLNQSQPAPTWTPVTWTLEDYIVLTAQVRVRFRVGDGPAGANIVEGAVDEVVVTVEGECNDPGDCDDGDPCTLDQCQFDGTCVHQPLSCLAIASSEPPSGSVDARQPHELGSGAIPLGLFQAELTFTGGAIAALSPADFTVEKQGGMLPAPLLVDVMPVDADTARLTWSEPLEPASWLGITHSASGTSVCLGTLPGDVNADNLATAEDAAALAALLDALPGTSPAALQADIDRSGVVDASDLTRLMDLFLGAGAFDPWLDTQAPPSPCPSAE